MLNHKDEIEKLSTAMKEAKSKRAYERYQAIYLHLQGYAKEEIATIIGRSKKTVYNYIYAYTQRGSSRARDEIFTRCSTSIDL
ncbi:transposase [Anoxybacillus gonensis]|nr:transposase [Anoxybacillus gonensis]